jgi:hypothetical protein
MQLILCFEGENSKERMISRFGNLAANSIGGRITARVLPYLLAAEYHKRTDS